MSEGPAPRVAGPSGRTSFFTSLLCAAPAELDAALCGEGCALGEDGRAGHVDPAVEDVLGAEEGGPVVGDLAFGEGVE